MSASTPSRPRRAARLLVFAGALAGAAWLSSALAQPAPEPPAKAAEPPARPAPAGDAPALGATGLPSWHPPVGQPGQPAQPGAQRPSPQELREMLRQRRRPGSPAAPPGAAAPPPPTPARATPPPAPKYPRDAHGHCIGQGPQDRPKDINLVHGWLGVNNEKAVPAPRPKGSWEWWKWRLIPYPWRYENHADECDPRNEPIPLLANVVNIGVLLFLLVRFGRRPMLESLRRRKGEIMAEIDKARAIRKSAQERLDRYEDELEHLDDRLAGLREQYALEGEREEQRVLRDMAEARERMMADAEFRVAQEGKSSRDELSRQALEDAMNAAEELLKTTVTHADHDRIAEEYLDQIGTALASGAAAGGAR